MIGEFAFQVLGAKWSGVRHLSDAIAKHPNCAVYFDESFGKFLSGKTETSAEQEQDLERRSKLRIDNFQRACWHKAGETPQLKWGHQTIAEDVAGLLDDAGAKSLTIDRGWTPERGRSNAIDYFICRCLRVTAVVIVRDGRAVIPALIQKDKLTAPAAVARWKFSIHLMKRVLYFTQRSYVVRFEDLVRDPGSTLSEVSDVLRIAYSDAMIANLRAGAKNPALSTDIDPGRLAAQTAHEPWVKEIEGELETCGYLE